MRVLSKFDLIEEKGKSVLNQISVLSLEYYAKTGREPEYVELNKTEFEAVMNYVKCEVPCSSDLNYVMGLEVIIKD